MTAYSDSFFIFALLLSMVVFQALVATIAHRKQTQYIPGVVDSKLDHHSFVFRSNRAFLNSLENLPLFILTAFLGMFAQVNASDLYWILVVFTAARFIHMVLFYVIATNKNPSPRSYFFIIGFFAQIYLLYLVFAAL